jgi:hypothetical protein
MREGASLAGVALLALALLWPGALAQGAPGPLVFILLPAALLLWLLAWMAGAALPLTLLVWLALPRRWLAGVPAMVVFAAVMLATPVLLLSGLAAATLVAKPPVWEPFTWRPLERPAAPPMTRHLVPTRSGASP